MGADHRARSDAFVCCAAGLAALAGCTAPDYYAQALAGQMELLAARHPVTALVRDPTTAPALRERLARSQALRDFAVTALALPDNGSYRDYAALGRPSVVWNVVATPTLALEPRQWCFPVAGCVSYRGYFREAEAEDFASGLRAAGDDVAVAGSPAYSTLGWFDDPLLDTFIGLSEGRLAELMFHELAHQRVYVPDDPAFNEAYATAVGRLGSRAWLRAHGEAGAQQDYEQALARQQAFIEAVLATRTELERLYASPANAADKRAAKAQAFAALQVRYAALKAGWGGYAGYDRWFEGELNNARLAGVSTYHRLVPAFARLFVLVGEDFAALHRAVEALGACTPAARQAYLQVLLGQAG